MDASRFSGAPLVYRLGALLLAFPLVVTGCSAESDTAASPSGSSAPLSSPSVAPSSGEIASDAAVATVQIAESTFEFSLTTCIVGEEDIVAQGAGASIQTGESAFLDVDFTSYEGSYVGGADIELGTDQPFTSSDDYYRLDPLIDDAGLVFSLEGASFVVEGAFSAHGAAPLPDGNPARGILRLTCEGI